jgi:hypothetical protein
MHAHNLAQMADVLVEAGLLAPGVTPKQVAEVLASKSWTRQIAIVWTAEDVQDAAKDMGMDVTDDMVDEVLRTLLRDHDADYGISWLVVRQAIRDVAATHPAAPTSTANS